MLYLPAEAFAVVREAAKRKLGMRHFDVQVLYLKKLCSFGRAKLLAIFCLLKALLVYGSQRTRI